MTVPGGRLPDFEPGAPGVTVDPTVGTTQPSPDPSAAQQQDPSPPGGAPAASAGAPEGAGTPPTPASTPPAPTAPAPQPPAEGPPPAAPAVPPEGQPQAAQPPPEGEEELTEEQYQQAKTRLDAEVRGELQTDYDARLEQSRTDSARATDAVKQELAATQERIDQMTTEMREGQIKGLSPEEQEKFRAAWANEDKVKEINAYQSEVEAYHAEADVVYLLGLYNQYGVTEEELTKVPIDERETFCEAKRANYWEQRAQGKGPPATNGQPQPPAQQAPPAPQQPVPAGVHAPSDAGGGGSVTPPPQPNTDQGLDAMAGNIGQRESWESLPPPPRRG